MFIKTITENEPDRIKDEKPGHKINLKSSFKAFIIYLLFIIIASISK